ncbi:MAG TPA: DUF4912 domain-containing protein [Dongiaceae bacterium]|nr:DUF4912 domain-containing protein [Dongiaceae bacterium]
MKKQASEPLQHIPWGYGVTRVTAMAVDPERLYAYWEITDADLERARATLSDSRLVMRVFDTTGRIFDGTNAHHSFDVAIQRSDRQWFLSLNRPNSSAVVEIALLGPQGAYVALARSKPVDFPRREPAPPTEPEWRIAEDMETPAGVERVRLKPAPTGTTPRASRTEGRGQGAPSAGTRPDRAGGSSEERLADRGFPGGGSEDRLRDNGKSRES